MPLGAVCIGSIPDKSEDREKAKEVWRSKSFGRNWPTRSQLQFFWWICSTRFLGNAAWNLPRLLTEEEKSCQAKRLRIHLMKDWTFRTSLLLMKWMLILAFLSSFFLPVFQKTEWFAPNLDSAVFHELVSYLDEFGIMTATDHQWCECESHHIQEYKQIGSKPPLFLDGFCSKKLLSGLLDAAFCGFCTLEVYSQKMLPPQDAVTHREKIPKSCEKTPALNIFESHVFVFKGSKLFSVVSGVWSHVITQNPSCSRKRRADCMRKAGHVESQLLMPAATIAQKLKVVFATSKSLSMRWKFHLIHQLRHENSQLDQASCGVESIHALSRRWRFGTSRVEVVLFCRVVLYTAAQVELVLPQQISTLAMASRPDPNRAEGHDKNWGLSTSSTTIKDTTRHQQSAKIFTTHVRELEPKRPFLSA